MTTAIMEFHWRDGKVDRGPGTGETPSERAADALNRLGYGGGALAALDYWQQAPETDQPVADQAAG